MPDIYIPNPFNALPTPRVTAQNDPGLPILGAALRGLSTATRDIAEAQQTKQATIGALNSFANVIETEDPAKAEAIRQMADDTKLIIPFGRGTSGPLKNAASGITNEMLNTIGTLVSDKQKSAQQLAEIAARGSENRLTQSEGFAGQADIANLEAGNRIALENLRTMNNKEVVTSEELAVKKSLISKAVLESLSNGQINQNQAGAIISKMQAGDVAGAEQDLLSSVKPLTRPNLDVVGEFLNKNENIGSARAGDVSASKIPPPTQFTPRVTNKTSVNEYGEITEETTITGPYSGNVSLGGTTNPSLDAAGDKLQKAVNGEDGLDRSTALDELIRRSR